jgi:photosystem II stability/assembly factor-like uncharacterized protein
MRSKHYDEPASIFALAPLPASQCLAATEQGLWQFNGKAWQQVAPQFAQVPLTSVAAHGNTWLIGSSGDIAISRDAGATWGIAQLPVKAHVLALALSPAFDRDGIALAATAKDGVLRSADGGLTWHAWNFGLLDLAINAIALSPQFGDDTTCFAASDHGVFISTNGGRAWSELPAGMENGPFTALAVTNGKGEPVLLAGSEGSGLWKAGSPFAQWQKVKGLRAEEINFLLPAIASTTTGVYAADGAKWTKLSEENDVVCMATLDDGTLVCGSAGAGVWHAK